MSIQVNLKTISHYAGCLLTLASTGFVNAEETKPNVVLILIDDSGWSDLGCYGSEIHTPTIDSLAYNGLRYRQFYNAARSSPTRCAILTGLYTQQVAVDPGASLPNLRNDNNVTIAELLGSNGYRTFLTGKWHLGGENNQRGPLSRGFQNVFYFGGAAVKSFWDSSLYTFKSENNEILPINYGNDQFYQTDAIGDYSVKFINHHFSKADGKPFFLYMAFGAGHWPLSAPEEVVNKYTDIADQNPTDEDYFNYEVGWDSTRVYRFNRQKELGVINEHYELSPRSDAIQPRLTQVPAWETLETKRQNDLARRMAVYGAMIHKIDDNVKKVVDLLKNKNQLDNTLIIFVSDNGGNYENHVFGNPNARAYDDLFTMGQPDDPTSFPRLDLGGGWANVCNTPLRLYKHFTHEGGIRTPGIFFYPNGISNPGTWVEQPAHIIDVMATVVDVTGVEYPETFNAHPVLPLEGKSLVPHFQGGEISDRQLFVEHENNRALYDGDYKLVTKNFAWFDGSSPAHEIELYNLKEDPVELYNIADNHPELVASMIDDWNAKATQFGVPSERLIKKPVHVDPELVFHFSFDNKLTDESAHNYQLVIGNNTTVKYVDGKYGQAVQLNGSGDYYDLPEENLLNPAELPLTACAWVYNNQPQADWNLTGGGIDEEQVLHQLNGRVVLHHIVSSNESNIGSWLGGAQYKSTVSNCFILNEWQHIAVVSDPQKLTNIFYVNGVQVGDTVHVSSAFTPSNGGFRIGAHKNLGSYWHGMLDEVCLFKGTLNGDQIQAIMNDDFNFLLSIQTVDKNKISIYPNPIKDILYINERENIKAISIFSMNGTKVMFNATFNDCIDISSLKPGCYISKIETTSDEVHYKKIIKE